MLSGRPILVVLLCVAGLVVLALNLWGVFAWLRPTEPGAVARAFALVALGAGAWVFGRLVTRRDDVDSVLAHRFARAMLLIVGGTVLALIWVFLG